MRSDEAFDLLIKIQAYDQRTIGDGDALAWSEALADVTLNDALDAVTDFFRSEMSTRTRCTPGHVVQAAKRRRRAAEDRAAQESQQPARIGAGPHGDDPFAGRRNSPQLEAVHTEAMGVPCTYKPCSVEAGDRCRNPFTGHSTKIPHTPRSVAARKAAESAGQVSVFP